MRPPFRLSRFGDKLIVIAGIALGIRLVHAWFVTRALGVVQIHDAAYYHDVASWLLGEGASPTVTSDVAFANVGYPYVLSWIYRWVFTPSAVLVFQAMAGAATTWLVGWVARDYFGRERVGLYAAALCAVYAPGIFYDGLLLTPSLSAFSSALLLGAMRRALVRRSLPWAVVAGAAIGAATLLRASQLLLLLGMSLAIYVSHQNSGDKPNAGAKARLLVALWLAVGICLAPLALRNWGHAGAFTPLTANGGSNFWIGNHRGASGSYEDAPFLTASKGGDFQHTVLVEREGFLEEARRRAEQPALTLVEADSFWWKETLREIAGAPAAWLRGVGQKLALTLNGYEPRTNASFDLLIEVSPILRFNPVRFGVLAVLALLGALGLRGKRHRLTVSVFAPVSLVPVFTCVAFFVSGEYRHPAYPALAALAGYGVHWLTVGQRRLTVRRAFSAWRMAVLCLVAVTCAFWPVRAIGPAKDRKAYAEALATPKADGTLPDRERYAMALALLERSTGVLEDEILSAEATLLVLSNRAIQFRDRDAARQLLEVARELWQRELDPAGAQEHGLDAAGVARLRGNLVRRVAQLARQSFVHDWPDIERPLALLGAHAWREFEPLLAAGNFRQGEEFLNEASRWAPHAVPVLAYRGQLAARRGEDPMTWFERSLDGYPKLALPALLLSEYLLGERRALEAIAVLQAATRERLYDETLRYTLGNLMHEYTPGQPLIDFFSVEDGRDEKPQTSHYFVALGYYDLGDADAAIAALQRALELDPAHELSQRLWGLLLERQGKLVPALEHLVEATRIHPEFRAALEDVARLAARLGHPAEAARWLERARLANPETPRRFVYWAKYLHTKGHDAAALNELRRRLTEDPRDPEALALQRTIGDGERGQALSSP